jgi:hypothetical protein
MTLMTYTNLVATKGTAGSIANWVHYSKVEPVLPTILEEAQALIYQLLRTREMQKVFSFKMAVGNSSVPLPSRWLDPIGDIVSTSHNFKFRQKAEAVVHNLRPFALLSGTLLTDSFVATINLSTVVVNKIAHGLTQGSVFTPAGVTPANGQTLDSSYEIVTINSADQFTINTGDVISSGSGAFGGASNTYTVSRLEPGQPKYWSVWEEKIQFDQAYDEQHTCQIRYYKALPLLSTTNPTNFLTDRHPQILRKACVAAAADWMEETETFNRAMQQLSLAVQRAQEEDDLRYRGADIETTNWGD